VTTARRVCVRSIGRAGVWRNVLIVQAVALLVDTIGVLVMRFPATMNVSRVIIAETIAATIVASALIGDRLVARGVRTIFAYALPLVVAAPFAALFEYTLRGWLGLYTIADRPGVDLAVRRSHMIYVICDILTYGAMLITIYLDYRRRLELVQRIRVAELARARGEADLVESRLAELRADVNPETVMAQLQRVRAMYDVDAARAERTLDAITGELRVKLSEPRVAAGEA
jgi:hypothetical protein